MMAPSIQALVLFWFLTFDYGHTLLDPDSTSSSRVVDSLEDIEALSFFVLYRKYPRLATIETPDWVHFSATNQSLDEKMLHDFLIESKHGNLLKRNSLFELPCSELTQIYISYVQRRSLSLSPISNQEKLDKMCEASRSCQSADELIKLINSPKTDEGGSSKEGTSLALNQAIVRLCPIMLFQINENRCAAGREDKLSIKLKPSPGAVWGFSFLFVTIISFCSLVGVALVPLFDRASFLTVLNVCEGLAVGSLVGSAIFHLIPQSFDLLAQDGKHDYLWKALIIFGGIYLFYWSERIMKIMVDIRRKKKLKEFTLASITEVSAEAPREEEKHVSFPQGANNGHLHQGDDNNALELRMPLRSNGLNPNDQNRDRSRSNSFNQRLTTHNHEHLSPNGEVQIATVAWMIIFGDALHNFIDGLSIGAAFSESILAGISISVAVICEGKLRNERDRTRDGSLYIFHSYLLETEFPHELGDFAVLIASGMTTRQAIGYNFLSACTCYLGMIGGILIGDFNNGSTYILALAGGMFLYIALVDMMG